MSEPGEAWRQFAGRLLSGKPLMVPTITREDLQGIKLQPGRLVRFDEAAVSRVVYVDLVSERARQVMEAYHAWLEPRLEEAFAAGMDFAVTRPEQPGDDQPRLDRDTLSWTLTIRWQGQMVEPGADLGPNWTVYRNPKPPESCPSLVPNGG